MRNAAFHFPRSDAATRAIQACLFAGLVVGLATCVRAASAQVKVVTTTPTYASLAETIGGRDVEVISLMKGSENVHRIVATPSKMIAMRDADVFIHSGLDLELWVPQLLRGSRNRKIQPGQSGNVNAARGIRLKEVPQEISRSQGDLHVYGNPHYVLDPINVILVARTVRDALKNADPDHAEAYAARYQQFEDRMKKKLLEWLTKLRPYQGSKVVGYHNVFPYFADRFGLKVIGFVEPKPGIEPSPRHIADLVEQMRQEKCKVLLLNTWADRTTARAVAQRVDAETVSFPEWVGGVDGTDDCIALFDYLVDSLIKAFERTSANPVASGARRRNGTDGGTSR